MKKTKVITTLALSAFVLGGLATSSYAATEKSVSTDGKVIFKTVGDDDEGEVTKPGTDEEIIVPGEGGHTTGPLRLTHVPAFDFGTIEIGTKTKLVDAKFGTFRETDPLTGQATGDVQEIAHFVQVEDVRGKKADWKVTVKSTKFIPAKATNKPLEKSRVVLSEAKLFNTSKDDVANRVEMLGRTEISNENTTDHLIMQTKPGQHTESSKTSVVFNDKYTKDDLVGGVPAPEANENRLNPGVKLEAFGTDEKAVDDVYTATLTWTLTSAL